MKPDQGVTSMKRYMFAISRNWARIVQSAAFVFALATLGGAPVNAKVPGKTYCFNGICHYVKTISETQRAVGRSSWVTASYYDDAKRDRFNPSNITSSGEYFRSWTPDNAASPVFPNGTKLIVWHPTTKKTVMVRVNNSGPYYGNRLLDLSRAAAERIGMSGSGIKSLQIAVVSAPSAEEARYSRGRSYAPVRGYMGSYSSLDSAVASVNGRAKSTRKTAETTAPIKKKA
jgi:rare lipoprotein A